jgi:hypothetical protein
MESPGGSKNLTCEIYPKLIVEVFRRTEAGRAAPLTAY